MYNRFPAPERRAFEEDGTFYAGHVKHKSGGRVIRRRCLCFALKTGVVGASADFSRAEAYHTAQRAQAGSLPPIPGHLRGGAKVAAILKARGFPINSLHDPSLEIDDTTAIEMGKEFAR